jgi:hypothetical protein
MGRGAHLPGSYQPVGGGQVPGHQHLLDAREGGYVEGLLPLDICCTTPHSQHYHTIQWGHKRNTWVPPKMPRSNPNSESEAIR